MNIRDLQEQSGTNSRDHGFHDDWPKHPPVHLEPHEEAAYQRQLGLAITEKLALIHEEISEALGEIRSGHDPLDLYFRMPDKSISASQFHEGDGTTVGKPEGFMVELADAVIRIADLAFLVGGDLESYIQLKAEYNRTRPYKHGRKF